MHVGRRDFDGGGQVEDDLVVLGGPPFSHNGFANLESVVYLSIGETLGRVLKANLRARNRFNEAFDQASAFDGDGFDFILRFVKSNASLHR